MSENIDIITRKENIVAIADAVRAKNGTTAEMTLGEIVSSIESIQTDEGIKTCTVTIYDDGYNHTEINYACLRDDGIFETVPFDGVGDTTTICENVICNQYISVSDTVRYEIGHTVPSSIIGASIESDDGTSYMIDTLTFFIGTSDTRIDINLG